MLLDDQGSADTGAGSGRLARAEPGRPRAGVLPRGEIPDAINPPGGCRCHPRCPSVLPTCGWEGRDFIDYLEQRRLDATKAQADETVLGVPEDWRANGLRAWRRTRDENATATVAYLRSIVAQAAAPMASAVEAVDVEESRAVVRFRSPDQLLPKEVEGRTVECLLY